jgi:hypothetical protein
MLLQSSSFPQSKLQVLIQRTKLAIEKIWKPLGMEAPGSWSLNSDASRYEKMESGINARAIDFAKIGRLFLNNENWEWQTDYF